MYNLLRIATKIKNHRLKMLGIWLFHILRKRYIGIFLDPVLACNLRCKMCYFSDEAKRKTYKGVLSYEDIQLIAKKLFHRALKLQIGCGAEPTVHKDWIKIVGLGKLMKVPNISLVTNGNLLTKEQLFQAVDNGLDEIIISVHGLTRETYESMMTNANFELFCNLLTYISEVKKIKPVFKLRINYTVNKDNIDDLSHIWEITGNTMDILQIRPIQKIGETEYNDFDLNFIIEKYETILLPIVEECHRRNVICIVPDKKNVLDLKQPKDKSRLIEKATYCYVSPQGCWHDDFDYHKDTFESFASKQRLALHLFSAIFKPVTDEAISVTRKMNYQIY